MKTIQPLTTFIINLDRSPDRLALMTEQCQNLGIHFERISGCDANILSPQKLEEIYDAHKVRKQIGRPLLLGEIGCARSHIQCWSLIKERTLPGAFIFEDDIKIDKNTPLIMAEIAQKAPLNKPIHILLSPCDRAYKKKVLFALDQNHQIVKNKQTALACGYYINHSAAVNLLKYFDKVHHPIDWWRKLVSKRVISSYLVLPHLVEPDECFESTIGHTQTITKDKHRLSRIRRLGYDLTDYLKTLIYF